VFACLFLLHIYSLRACIFVVVRPARKSAWRGQELAQFAETKTLPYIKYFGVMVAVFK